MDEAIYSSPHSSPVRSASVPFPYDKTDSVNVKSVFSFYPSPSKERISCKRGMYSGSEFRVFYRHSFLDDMYSGRETCFII